MNWYNSRTVLGILAGLSVAAGVVWCAANPDPKPGPRPIELDVLEGRAVVPQPPDERVLSDVFQLELLPETTNIAPVQPLYVRVRLTNLLTKRVAIPRALHSGNGIGLFVTDDRQQHACLIETAPFGCGRSLGPREHIDWHAVVCIDFHPPDPRRSPRRVFDLDGDYGLHAAHRCDPNDNEQRLCSEMIRIKVRKPADDEQAASKIFSRGNLVPPLHASEKGEASASLIPEIRELLDQHPKSAFADDLRWLLAKQIEHFRGNAETQRERDLATAEFLEQLVQIDPKRVSMRRMICFAKPPHENHLVFKPSVTKALCNPKVQKLIDVPKFLKQLRQSPPYFPEDTDLANRMEQALVEVEATLRMR